MLKVNNTLGVSMIRTIALLLCLTPLTQHASAASATASAAAVTAAANAGQNLAPADIKQGAADQKLSVEETSRQHAQEAIKDFGAYFFYRPLTSDAELLTVLTHVLGQKKFDRKGKAYFAAALYRLCKEQSPLIAELATRTVDTMWRDFFASVHPLLATRFPVQSEADQKSRQQTAGPHLDTLIALATHPRYEHINPFEHANQVVAHFEQTYPALTNADLKKMCNDLYRKSITLQHDVPLSHMQLIWNSFLKLFRDRYDQVAAHALEVCGRWPGAPTPFNIASVQASRFCTDPAIYNRAHTDYERQRKALNAIIAQSIQILPAVLAPIMSAYAMEPGISVATALQNPTNSHALPIATKDGVLRPCGQLIKNLHGLNKPYNVVDLRQNLIARLDADSFLFPIHTSLFLSDNLIQQIAPGTFAQQCQLKILHLSDNFLTEITPDMFVGLQSLEDLILNSNYLSEIPAGTLTQLPNLKTIRIDMNRLTHVPVDLFAMPQITNLTMHANPLLPAEQEKLKKLQAQVAERARLAELVAKEDQDVPDFDLND
jgi:hypothetical protein